MLKYKQFWYSWLSITLTVSGPKKSSTYWELEFSKSLIETVKTDTGVFGKSFSSFVFFWKSQLQFKLSIHSWNKKLSMFSTKEQILFLRVLNIERSCSISNTSSTSLVKGHTGGILSSSSWSSSLSHHH